MQDTYRCIECDALIPYELIVCITCQTIKQSEEYEDAGV